MKIVYRILARFYTVRSNRAYAKGHKFARQAEKFFQKIKSLV